MAIRGSLFDTIKSLKSNLNNSRSNEKQVWEDFNKYCRQRGCDPFYSGWTGDDNVKYLRQAYKDAGKQSSADFDKLESAYGDMGIDLWDVNSADRKLQNMLEKLYEVRD